MKSILCVVLVVTLISFCSACGKFTGASGTTYDLSPLTKPTNAPWEGKEAGTNFIFYWNFCANLVGVPAQVETTGPATVIQLDPSVNGAHATGRLSAQTIAESSNGIEITYKNMQDDFCRDASGVQTIQRTTFINIECDKKATAGTFISVTEPSQNDPATRCKYYINMKHSAACKGGAGGAGGLSGGSIFLIIFFCLAAVYVIGGIVFNKVRNNAAGTDLIPNYAFWAGLPGLIVDGFKFIKNKFTGGSYSSL